MDPLDQMRSWSHQRQRLGDPAATAEEALRSVLAVYSVHPTAPLALAARCPRMTPSEYRRLDNEKRALRIPAMRASAFLVPRDAAPRIFTATRRSASVVVGRARSIGLSEEDYEKTTARVLEATAEPRSQRELEDTTDLKGAALARLLRTVRMEGRLLVLGGDNLRAGDLRYVARDAWVDEELAGGSREEALTWLAGAYLRAYGPARVEDFVWWTGAGRREAAVAVGAQDTVDVGDGLLLPADQQADFDAVRRVPGTVDLLPKWDSYTMGYAPDGRARLISPDLQDRLYSKAGDRGKGATSGDAYPVVLVDGQAVALWSLTVKEGPAAEFFDSPGPRVRRRIQERLAAVQALLQG